MGISQRASRCPTWYGPVGWERWLSWTNFQQGEKLGDLLEHFFLIFENLNLIFFCLNFFFFLFCFLHPSHRSLLRAKAKEAHITFLFIPFHSFSSSQVNLSVWFPFPRVLSESEGRIPRVFPLAESEDSVEGLDELTRRLVVQNVRPEERERGQGKREGGREIIIKKAKK